MSLGVEFDLKVAFVHVHFSFHLGAGLGISGPPFHGYASIDLDVISFTIHFGDDPVKPDLLRWEQFRAILPGDPKNDATNSALLSAKGLRED